MILVSKNSYGITISNNGKKMIIDNEDELYNKLIDKTKEEIILWFKGVKKID